MSKDRDDLSNMIDKLELIDQIDTHAFLLSTHGTYINIDYLLSQKRIFSKALFPLKKNWPQIRKYRKHLLNIDSRNMDIHYSFLYFSIW